MLVIALRYASGPQFVHFNTRLPRGKLGHFAACQQKGPHAKVASCRRVEVICGCCTAGLTPSQSAFLGNRSCWGWGRQACPPSCSDGCVVVVRQHIVVHPPREPKNKQGGARGLDSREVCGVFQRATPTAICTLQTLQLCRHRYNLGSIPSISRIRIRISIIIIINSSISICRPQPIEGGVHLSGTLATFVLTHCTYSSRSDVRDAGSASIVRASAAIAHPFARDQKTPFPFGDCFEM